MNLRKCFSASIYALLSLLLLPQLSNAQFTAPVRTFEASVTQTQIDSSIGEAEDVANLLKPYVRELEAKMGIVLGTAPVAINKEGPAAGALGRLMTEVIQNAAKRKLKVKVDLGFQNNGGIRAEIPAGKVTMGTMFRIMPFDNEIAVVDMTGAQLQRLFEDMGKTIVSFGAAVSGVSLVYRDGRLVSARIGGKSINKERIYRVALTDYLFKGGGDYPILWEASNYQPTGILLRDAMIDYIKQKRGLVVAPKKVNIRVEGEHSGK